MEEEIDVANKVSIGLEDESVFGGISEPGELILVLLLKGERLAGGEKENVRILHPLVVGGHYFLGIRNQFKFIGDNFVMNFLCF